MIVRKTAWEEARRVNELFAICFEMPYTNCPANPEKDDATHWAAFDEDGEMMSTFTISDFTVQFDGSPCKMGGIGGVATLPQYRRRGGIRACFREALPDMYGSGYDFSYLYPFSTAYYRKFGYENCVQKYGWTVDLSLLNPPKEGGSFRLAEKGCPMTAEIRALDAIWESHYNMMVLHGDEDYDWTRKCDPAVKQDFTYVCFDVAGGHEVVEPASKGFILRYGQVRLTDKPSPAEHRLLHAQQRLAAVCRRQLRDGQPGIGFICLEFAQGDSTLGAALDGDVPAVPIQVNATGHGIARPRGVALLVGEGGFRGFGAGVQTVEHGHKKGAPCAFTPLVGGSEDVQPRLEGQLRVLQLAEGGGHFVDFHSVTSRPSSSFREISAAS